MSEQSQVLVVEDDETFRESIVDLVQHEGFTARGVATLAEAGEALDMGGVELLIVDRGLPDGDGVDHALEQGWVQRAEVVVLTGSGTVESAVAALRRGITDYLTKPLDRTRLRAALAQASRAAALKDEVRDLRNELRNRGQFGSIVGRSAAMQPLFDMITRVAPTDASVLVVGESGTGKEVVAATLHAMSPRRKGPLLAINCGAIPESLIESELFGHEKGSFTGATKSRQGCFQRADGGTLFLDEITEMPHELQVKLLRVLETDSVTPLGSSETFDVDVRIVAATNRDPLQAIEDEQLREDLYYRLAVFPVVLPPLRDREGDVELLAWHFLEQMNREAGTKKMWSETALAELAAHDWPGNVRELHNVVQRAFILSDERIHSVAGALSPWSGGSGATSRSSDAHTLIPRRPPEAAQQRSEAAAVSGTSTQDNPGPFSWNASAPSAWNEMTLKDVRDAAIAEVERVYVDSLLRATAGNVGRTAERAGVGPRALYGLMKRRGLRKEDYRA